MNTEIKYRLALKRKDDIQLVEFTFEQLLIGAAFVWMLDNGYSREDIISTDEYTGLKDKNGKEIYKGDILNVCNGSINSAPWMDKPYTVEYILNKGFNICMFCWNKKGESVMDSTHWCEVIGNIYQNPELLK